MESCFRGLVGRGDDGEMGCVIAWYEREKSRSKGRQTNRKRPHGATDESYHATGMDRKQDGGGR